MPGLLDGIASTEIRSLTVSGTESQFSTGSFANVRVGTNFTGAGSVTDAQGRVRSISLGSTSTFGGFIQTGSATKSGGSLGYALLGTAYSNTNFYVQVTGRQYADGVGSVTPWISGARTTSGVNFVGAASTVYDWMAIGT